MAQPILHSSVQRGQEVAARTVHKASSTRRATLRLSNMEIMFRVQLLVQSRHELGRVSHHCPRALLSLLLGAAATLASMYTKSTTPRCTTVHKGRTPSTSPTCEIAMVRSKHVQHKQGRVRACCRTMYKDIQTLLLWVCRIWCSRCTANWWGASLSGLLACDDDSYAPASPPLHTAHNVSTC